jgi:glycosyltransferase involved in cell wall biosynthesis
MRILMIAPEPFFEPRGTPFSVYHRARALSELGHTIDLVTYHVGADVILPRVTLHRAPRLPFVRRVKIGPSLLKFPLDALLFAATLRLLLRGRYDCIHTHEEAGLLGAVLGRLFRVPHVYDMHSQLSQQLTNFGFTRSRALIGLMRGVERAIIQSARVVIVICQDFEDVVAGIAPGKPVVLIENTAVTADIATTADPGADMAGTPERPRRALGRTERRGPVLLYTGTFESYQGLELLVESMPAVLEQFPDATYVLVGGRGKQIEALEVCAERWGVRHALRLPGQRPPGEMAALMAQADVLLSPRTTGTNTPLKIYSYLRAGRPLLATRIQSHTQTVTDAEALLVEPTSRALAEGAITLLGDEALRRRLAERAGQLAAAKYSDEAFLERTAEAYQWVAARPVVAAATARATRVGSGS